MDTTPEAFHWCPQQPDLPVPLLYQHDEIPYTACQLAPTIERLRRAVTTDLEVAGWSEWQRLAAAWTRIAELRLPRKAVPQPVLDAIEDLVLAWSQHGIDRYAAALTPEAVLRERERIAWMLTVCEEAAANAPATAIAMTD